MNPLRDALASYVNMRRGFGYKLRTQEYLLINFVAFMEARNATIITNKLVLDWTTCTARPVTWPTRLSAVRSFARHLSCIEPRTQIPPTGILGKPQRRAPHIYTEQELNRLLEAMLALAPAKRLRRWTYYCLFGLLSVTGLRISEAFKLKRDDVDLEAGLLTIRETKFGKSRFVPIHPSTITVLTDYAVRRDARQSRSTSPYFFTNERGGPLHHHNVYPVFCEVSRQLGLRTCAGGGAPRIHDLRHSYAVATLLRWYRAGDDVERLLPVLSTYLGHSHTRDTYWYLSACPELMEHAARRLEARWEGVS